MIELVQHDARLEPLEREAQRRAVKPEGANLDPRRPPDVGGDVRQRQTSLAPDLAAIRRDDGRIDQDPRAAWVGNLFMPGAIDEDHAPHRPDLRGGEPDGARIRASRRLEVGREPRAAGPMARTGPWVDLRRRSG